MCICFKSALSPYHASSAGLLAFADSGSNWSVVGWCVCLWGLAMVGRS